MNHPHFTSERGRRRERQLSHVANVTTPSLGRKLKPNVAVQVEVEHAKLEKQQRQQAALDWVVSVANRMGL